MYHLGDPGIPSVEMREELHREGHGSATVILVEEDGVGDTVPVHHREESLS